MSDVSQIDGNAIRLKRESQGWAIVDLASRACLSVKQIRQIEEGGMTAFYSESVKLTAARKVAGLLQMSETQLFGQQLPPVDAPLDHDNLLHASVHVSPPPGLAATLPAAPAGSPLMRSEALHVLAQPPEHVDEETDTAETPAKQESLSATDPAPVPKAHPVLASDAPEPPAEAEQPTSGSGYLLKIAALFLVALAAAALLRPQVLEEKLDAPAVVDAPAAPPVSAVSGPSVTERAPPASAEMPAGSASAPGQPAAAPASMATPVMAPAAAPAAPANGQ